MQLVGLIPPSYLEVSIGDTQEHPLGVYLEKESLYFNYLNWMPNFVYLIDNAMLIHRLLFHSLPWIWLFELEL